MIKLEGDNMVIENKHIKIVISKDSQGEYLHTSDDDCRITAKSVMYYYKTTYGTLYQAKKLFKRELIKALLKGIEMKKRRVGQSGGVDLDYLEPDYYDY